MDSIEIIFNCYVLKVFISKILHIQSLFNIELLVLADSLANLILLDSFAKND